MPETEPEARGPLLEMLGAALADVGKLDVLVAYAPGISNRTTHLQALQGGIEGLAAVIADANPLDDPEDPDA